MHSEFLLVEKGTGILYHWAYESEVACGIAMEISSSQEPAYLPLAKPHPLGEAIGLDSEEVCLLASSNVRCSLVTTSGKICTFYDKLLRGKIYLDTCTSICMYEESHKLIDIINFVQFLQFNLQAFKFP